MDLKTQIESFEGRVLHAYQDSLGYWTIGVGHLIDKRRGGGISNEVCDFILAKDLAAIEIALAERWPWVLELNEPRYAVVAGMAFQLGIEGLAGFKNTLSAIERGYYEAAYDGMINSLWARQTPRRALVLARQMLTGEWQQG